MMPGKQEQQHSHLAIARRYRPQRFNEVIGQDATVTTLKNAIRQGRIAHAYLFSGPRGTGKTSLARLFAKALNCISPTHEGEPCNQCASCREISQGSSMDVLEIDGASNRGIEDIRKINDTVSYAASSGKYKIYIIDEVHMLTKEAFNALLKTLEEPPAHVLFIFATTEQHKVLPTILSRCQRFNLQRLSKDAIVRKLERIAKELERNVEPAVFRMVAARAEGGLRDAESLFDQLLSFHEGELTVENASNLLGALSSDAFFRFDLAGKEGKWAEAFLIAAEIFDQGKDLFYFLQTLTEHFRTLLTLKLAGENSPLIELDSEDKKKYALSATYYREDQLLTILDLCIAAESQLKSAPSPRVALEGLLLKIMRTYQLIPVDLLVKKLAELEAKILNQPAGPAAPAVPAVPAAPVASVTPPVKAPIKTLTEDPTPRDYELPKKPAAAAAPPPPPPPPTSPVNRASQVRFDTLMQFAAVELEGKIIKK